MSRSSHVRTVIGVGGVVRLGDGIVLVRLTYSRHRGKFMLPGGKVEHGESLEAALVREVREETGIEAEPDGIVAVRHRVDPDELNTFVIFEMRHVRGSPRVVSPEADEVRVFSADDLRRMPEDFVSLVPEIALPVLDGRYTRLWPNESYLPRSGYDRDTFRIFGPSRRTVPEPECFDQRALDEERILESTAVVGRCWGGVGGAEDARWLGNNG